uniref:Uncharacterized protein n=1 Tax=Anguilla anguilla TaxID=7936 RepID=A0A0E9XW14_ANGAN
MDMVGRWKKYFEELLNLTDTRSFQEVELEKSEVSESISVAEVTGVLESSSVAEAPGMDEIHPEIIFKSKANSVCVFCVFCVCVL